MDIVPVKKYRQPRYPNKHTVLAHPQMLKTLPERWKGNVYIGVALSTLIVFTLSGCGRDENFTENKPLGTSTHSKAAVAPIFEHGNGRGSFGCMSVAPPSFLSEEEAFQVIQEEAERYGVLFDKAGLAIKKAKIPETKYYLTNEGSGGGVFQKSGKIDSTQTGDLQLDGYDEAKKIGFEFISKADYDNWHVDEGVFSSVEDFDFLTTAKILRDGLADKPSDNSIGIFYNTMTGLSFEEVKDQDWATLEAEVKEVAENELRKQVKDFLEWLKSQGIL